jgi:hypothetical protein
MRLTVDQIEETMARMMKPQLPCWRCLWKSILQIVLQKDHPSDIIKADRLEYDKQAIEFAKWMKIKKSKCKS